jgi:hypothetical protein
MQEMVEAMVETMEEETMAAGIMEVEIWVAVTLVVEIWEGGTLEAETDGSAFALEGRSGLVHAGSGVPWGQLGVGLLSLYYFLVCVHEGL